MPTYLSPGVYVEEVEAGSRPIEGVGTAVAAFVGLAAKGPTDTPTLITNWSQFTQTFGDFMEGSYLAHAVYGYFMNGGGSCYVVRVGGNGASPSARTELPAGPDGKIGAYRVTALEAGPGGHAITVEVADPGEGATEDHFKLIVRRDDKVVEEYDKLTTKKGRQNVVTVVNAQSKLIQLEEIESGGALEKPGKGSFALTAVAAPAAHLAPDDYVGNSADRTGFGGLESVDPITMVCVPDLMAAYQRGMIDAEGLQAVQLAMIAHCELMGDRVAILDPPPNMNAQQIREWRVDKVGYDSKYA
ncbi:MAG: phage tail sheath family protein, partial [Actinomycetota bacterium]